DPLDWWWLKHADVQHLVGLARGLVTVPVRQAESERLLSCADNVVMKDRSAFPP
ncbi:unnamed protein product, partial [Sphacelaria rigidula]